MNGPTEPYGFWDDYDPDAEKHYCEEFVSTCCGAPVLEGDFCSSCRDACGPAECVEGCAA